MSELHELLERAIPSDGPGLPPASDRLAVGRRAVRQRSLSFGAGIAAVAVLAGVALPHVGGARTSDRSVDVAGHTQSGPTPSPITAGSDRDAPLLTYDLGTDLHVLPGATIRERVDNPASQGSVTSTAAVVDFEGKTYWAFAATIPGDSGWSADHEAVPGRTFAQWLREQVVMNTPTSGDNFRNNWLTLNDNGSVTPNAGVRLRGVVTPARLDQAPAGVPSAAGMFEVDGARICFVARRGTSDDGITYFPEAEYPGCGDLVPGWAYAK